MSETKQITISEFLKKYNAVKSEDLKAKQIQGIIKRTYCPIIEKRMILNLMVEKSVVEDDIPYIDMFTNKLNLYAAIISMYTYIVPDKDEEGKPKSYEMYDLLVENDLIAPIFELIGEKELGEIKSINGLLIDTWYSKNTSTEAYIKNLVETASRKFSVVAGASMDKLADVLSDEKKMNKVMTALDKVMKKVK